VSACTPLSLHSRCFPIKKHRKELQENVVRCASHYCLTSVKHLNVTIKIRFTFNPKSVKQNVVISNHTTNTSKQNISDESDAQLRRGGTENAGLQYARPDNNRLENDGRLC